MTPIARFWRGILVRTLLFLALLGVVALIRLELIPLAGAATSVLAGLVLAQIVAGLIGYASMIERTKGAVRNHGEPRNPRQ